MTFEDDHPTRYGDWRDEVWTGEEYLRPRGGRPVRDAADRASVPAIGPPAASTPAQDPSVLPFGSQPTVQAEAPPSTVEESLSTREWDLVVRHEYRRASSAVGCSYVFLLGGLIGWALLSAEGDPRPKEVGPVVFIIGFVVAVIASVVAVTRDCRARRWERQSSLLVLRITDLVTFRRELTDESDSCSVEIGGRRLTLNTDASWNSSARGWKQTLRDVPDSDIHSISRQRARVTLLKDQPDRVLEIRSPDGEILYLDPALRVGA
ncbi:MAG: hypothetical protein EPO26_07715 [Chloroflexota bacterium]|nr:MAG: hypothetical protein EPO26_07715 [Chloroflexota bacterium]